MFDDWIIISCVLLTMAECGVMIALHYMRPYLVSAWVRELGLPDLKVGITAKHHELKRLGLELKEAQDIESSLNSALRKLNEEVRSQEQKRPVLLHSRARSTDLTRPFACALRRSVTIESRPLKDLWSRENIALIWALDEQDALQKSLGFFPRALSYECGPLRDTVEQARADWAALSRLTVPAATGGGAQ